jgi:hypothetical protein
MSQQDPEQMQGAQPAAPAPAVEAPVAQPAVERQIDPSYVAQLENYARQQQAEINRYESVKEDLDWMLEDPTRVEGVKRYRNAYTEAAKPKFDPAIEPVMEYVKSEIAPVREWVDGQRKSAEQRAQAERQSYEAENMRYLQRITAEQKLSPEQQMKLAGYADAAAQRLGRNVPIEEAWKDFSGGWGQPKTDAAKAPVLRSEEGAVGVPGPSAPDSKRWVTDFHGALADALRAEQKSA